MNKNQPLKQNAFCISFTRVDELWDKQLILFGPTFSSN